MEPITRHDGPMSEALVDEAMKKSSLIWLELADRTRPAWYLWHEGAAYVLTGGSGEQPMPGLPEADRVTVICRSKDKGNRLVSWIAAVEEVVPGSEEWTEIAPLVAKERLNSRPQNGESREDGLAHNPLPRWSHESYLMKLTPTGEYPETPGDHPAGYASVRTVPNPATNVSRRPFMVGGKRRKIDR